MNLYIQHWIDQLAINTVIEIEEPIDEYYKMYSLILIQTFNTHTIIL